MFHSLFCLDPNQIYSLWEFFQAEILSMCVTFAQTHTPYHLSVWIWTAIAPSFWRILVRRFDAFVEQKNGPWEEYWTTGARVLLLFVVGIRVHRDISNLNVKAHIGVEKLYWLR